MRRRYRSAGNQLRRLYPQFRSYIRVTCGVSCHSSGAAGGLPARTPHPLLDALAAPDALDPGFHCVRTHWIRGFMTFQLARRTRTVMLMVPVCPESVYAP
jgi:hypothetical protein